MDGTGAVISSTVEATDVADPGVANCIAAAVELWTFPAPQRGASVDILCSFELSSRAG